MKERSGKRLILGLLLTVCSMGTAFANPYPVGTPFSAGDVFAAVGNSTVDVFSPNGTLIGSLNDLSGATFTTGMAFDAAGNLYVTNFDAGTISKFSNTGALISSAWATADNTPESIVAVSTGPNAGTFFVGGPSGTAHDIQQFDANGTLLRTITVAGGNGTGGTDWLDFANDNTILYDGEGNIIKSYDINTNTQNPDFATSSAAAGRNFALRVIPTGAFAGDVLVADSTQVELFGSTGTLLRTYTMPGCSSGCSDFALNLDPNGTDFWTADPNTAEVWEVNIATGAIDEQWNTGTGGNTLFGLAVAGELTTTGGGSVPEPSSLATVVLAAGFMALKVRRKVA